MPTNQTPNDRILCRAISRRRRPDRWWTMAASRVRVTPWARIPGGLLRGCSSRKKTRRPAVGRWRCSFNPAMPGWLGRPIVVLAPYKIPAELFKFIPFDADSPAGQLIEVWLRYDESATQRARPGFEVCDRADQFSRVQETFRVEIEERTSHQDRHNPISVAGYRWMRRRRCTSSIR